MEKKIKKITENLKRMFGDTFDPPNDITPEMTNALLIAMSAQFSKVFEHRIINCAIAKTVGE